ncbi:HNH endonuclease [[Eubacterium] cellulosolvens]
MSWPMDDVSGAVTVSGAAPKRHRTDYPPRWSRMSRWVRGRASWHCELCGVKNGPPPNLLTVHHLDGNKWNLLPWNLAALCQRCHCEVQWTVDFYQANLTGVYPGWLRAHVEAYDGWARNKGCPQLALAIQCPHQAVFFAR